MGTSDTHERGEKRLAGALAVLFAGVLVLVVVDLIGDLAEGPELGHVLLEGAIGLLALVGIASMLVWLRALAARTFAAEVRAEGLAQHAEGLAQRAEELAQRLEASRSEAERWRGEASELIAGLGSAIDRQLDRWSLSAAEKEVALLLLKGLSHKEIGEVRSVGEATVRQQARAVYKKAGLGGRADLAAFFLEDLLSSARASSPPPAPDGGGASPTPSATDGGGASPTPSATDVGEAGADQPIATPTSAPTR